MTIDNDKKLPTKTLCRILDFVFLGGVGVIVGISIEKLSVLIVDNSADIHSSMSVMICPRSR
jgi:hypothetical protein